MKQAAIGTGWAAAPDLGDGVGICVMWVPGYNEARDGCQHEQKGNHGRMNDQLWFALRHFDAGISMCVNLPSIRRERDRGHRSGQSEGWTTRFHTAFSITEEQARGIVKPGACDILGYCFEEQASTLLAPQIWTRADAEIAHEFICAPDIVWQAIGMRSGVWERLNAQYQARYVEAFAASRALGVACPTCSGKGLVPRSV